MKEVKDVVLISGGKLLYKFAPLKQNAFRLIVILVGGIHRSLLTELLVTRLVTDDFNISMSLMYVY